MLSNISVIQRQAKIACQKISLAQQVDWTTDLSRVVSGSVTVIVVDL